jgi:carboxymethylenebutenolidase
MSTSKQAGSDPRYAPAAGAPVEETTISTDTVGLSVSRGTLPSRGGQLPYYAAWPESGSNRPVVLIVSEAFGLHEHIADIARRFAKLGYFAIAPDLMYRQGDPMQFADIDSLVNDLLLKIPDQQVLDDLDACVEWAAMEGGDTHHLAATGFCWGGRWVWLYAAHRQFESAVAWYGIVDGTATVKFPEDPSLFPSHPVDLGGKLKTPVLGLYGGLDEAIPVATVEAMRERLQNGSPAARASKMCLYANAGHAFFADYRESYEPVAARDAWQKCIDWIEHSGRQS